MKFIVVHKDTVLFTTSNFNYAFAWLTEYARECKLIFWMSAHHRGREDVTYYDGNDTYYDFAIIREE